MTLGFAIIALIMTIALFISRARQKIMYYDLLIDNSNIYEKIEKAQDKGLFDSILDVDKFNDWFNRPDKSSYANEGIFLRLDKLCGDMINEYIEYELFGLVEPESFDYSKKSKFETAIRKDWIKRKEGKY